MDKIENIINNTIERNVNTSCDLIGCQYNEDKHCTYATAKIKIPFATACVSNAMINFEE